ncbi:DUF4232 domain-containing protein [Streptomyces sp. NPDC048639]|uniref:DUF4232 domain-containing protein n=1 Tax=Streptomyces sp. NPDC048639 TaxID=3365581 RepID=UPI003722991E
MSSTLRTLRSNRSLRVAAACLTAAAALSLTACNNDAGGVRSSGDTQKSSTEQSAGQKSQGNEARTSGSEGKDEAANGSGTSTKTDAVTRSCSPETIQVEAEAVKSPINHMVLVATNNSDSACNLHYYPFVGEEGAQSTLQPVEESKPQAVATLDPGQSAYAGVLLSAADGSGGEGRETENFTVGLADSEGSPTSDSPMIVEAPGGKAHVDDSAKVTYWLTDMKDAISF